MTNEECIFPEEGFAVEETAGEDKKDNKKVEAEASAEVAETPWLDFLEQYPEYRAEELPEGMVEAVEKGEKPLVAYLRLENERLKENLRLMKEEGLLRRASVGSAKSCGEEEAPDEFIQGLMGKD